MKALLNLIYRGTENICAVFLAITTILLFTSVVGRQIGHSIIFSEELSLFLYVWMVSLGAAIITRDNTHPAITFIPDCLPKKIQLIYQCIIYLLIMVFCAILLYQGIQLTALVYPRAGTTINISMSFAYAAIPVGVLFMLVFCVENIFKLFKKLGASDENLERYKS